jgi:hypothetical protein
MPWRRNEAAAVEITALAAGAGPPANKIATRRIDRRARVAFEEMDSSELMRCSNSRIFSLNQFILTLTAIGHGDNGTARRGVASHVANRLTWAIPAFRIDQNRLHVCSDGSVSKEEGAILVRRVRFSIAGLMLAIGVTALVLAAARNGSPAWASAILMLTCGVLGLSIVGVVSRTGNERVWWLGFALFGCGYLVLAFWSEADINRLPTTRLIEVLFSKIRPNFPKPAAATSAFPPWTVVHISHCVWALLAASLGGALAYALFHARDSAGEPINEVSETARQSRSVRLDTRWWSRPAVIWPLGFALVGLAAIASSRAAPGIWAGIVFLLTGGLLSLATLGAMVGHRGRRKFWLGAALFGWSYMVFSFGRASEAGWPYPPTTHLLNAIRPGERPHWSGFPDASDRFNAKSQSVRRALERRIPMHFPDGAPLEIVLKYIKAQTASAGNKGIPIYVDPLALRFTRNALASPVRIDIDGLPLERSLDLCLNQLDLTFAVRDGFLIVTEPGAALPAYEDPFLVVGHCVLALSAAAVGAAVVPIVAPWRES